MANTKQVTVRMPEDLIESINRLGFTYAAYIVEAVRAKVQRDKEAEIAEGLKCLADDSDADDFSALAAAQAKVIARVD